MCERDRKKSRWSGMRIDRESKTKMKKGQGRSLRREIDESVQKTRRQVGSKRKEKQVE